MKAVRTDPPFSDAAPAVMEVKIRVEDLRPSLEDGVLNLRIPTTTTPMFTSEWEEETSKVLGQPATDYLMDELYDLAHQRIVGAFLAKRITR